MSGLALGANPSPLQAFSRPGLAESQATHSATPEKGTHNSLPDNRNPLGSPLSIREIAELVGCSPWTIRQRYMPQGLPHFRSGPQGKLVFFRDQVIRWILERQQKGGIRS
jgi:hypothetical protein